MILAAFLDAGLSINVLRKQISCLGLKDIRLIAAKVSRGELFGTKLEIIYKNKKTAQKLAVKTLPGVLKLIDKSRLSKEVKKISKIIFRRLARAESEIHQEKISRIHFHELSRPDTLIDIVGTAAAICALGIDKIYTSPLPFNCGCVRSAVGPLPLPAPAVLALVKDYPMYFSPVSREIITPTGAGIVTALAGKKRPAGNYKILKVGYGAGSRIIKELPNLLRIVIAERKK